MPASAPTTIALKPRPAEGGTAAAGQPSRGGGAPQATGQPVAAPPVLEPASAHAASGPVPFVDGESYGPGTRLGGFELSRLIGRGGMGAVYEALDTQLSRTVALKTLTAGLANRAEAVSRFKLEAQAAAQLLHPNVVAVHAFGVDQGVAYMAMECLRGETLAAAIARGPLSPERTADIMLAVCSGIHAAHRAGIVHRDIKPSNIFLARDWFGERPKVLDFGISKLTGDSGGLTQTGDIVGTSQYLSPEQAAGRRDLDARSDQYSLAVVIYECLTQQTPSAGENLYSLIRNIVEGRHRPVRQLRAEIAPEIEAVIEKAMSVQPDDRFASVRELGLALLAFASEPAKRQWSDHYTAAEPPYAPARVSEPPPGSEAVGGDAATQADAQAARTAIVPGPRPETWQLRPTRTAALPAGTPPQGYVGQATAVPQWVNPSDSTSLSTVTVVQRRKLNRVLVVAGLAVLLAVAALAIGRAVLRGRASPAAVTTPPAAARRAAPADVPIVPAPGRAAAAEVSAGTASAIETATPGASEPVAPVRPDKADKVDGKPRSRGKRVKYTPAGLPII